MERGWAGSLVGVGDGDVQAIKNEQIKIPISFEFMYRLFP
jgi:hypothetical protein